MQDVLSIVHCFSARLYGLRKLPTVLDNRPLQTTRRRGIALESTAGSMSSGAPPPSHVPPETGARQCEANAKRIVLAKAVPGYPGTHSGDFVFTATQAPVDLLLSYYSSQNSCHVRWECDMLARHEYRCSKTGSQDANRTQETRRRLGAGGPKPGGGWQEPWASTCVPSFGGSLFTAAAAGTSLMHVSVAAVPPSLKPGPSCGYTIPCSAKALCN